MPAPGPPRLRETTSYLKSETFPCLYPGELICLEEFEDKSKNGGS